MSKGLVIWGVIVLVIIVIVGSAGCLIGAMMNWPSVATPTPTRTIVVNIEQVRQVAELATVKTTLSTDVTAVNVPEDVRQIFGVKEEIVLIAYGEVAAGFDLSTLGPNDLWVDGTRVQLHLPAPKILYTRLDNERTHVVYYKSTWFIEKDPNLGDRARQEAEALIQKAALESGILEQAARYGELFFTNWFYSMGFTEVRVVVD